MNTKIYVCYLYTAFDKKKSLTNFIKNYKKYKSGLNHNLIVCYKLLDFNTIIKLRKLLKNIKHIEFIDPGKENDWDFGSYKRVSKKYIDKDILFLNSHSYPYSNNWLKKFFLYKKKNTVIASTASYESMLDSIKLKKKYHKIFRYLIRKYKFSKNFNKFPNPHIRTTGFLINSRIFYNFIKEKDLFNKEDTLMIESGKNSLTNFLKNKKFKIFIVNSDGEKFIEKKWYLSETFNYRYKSKNIISDKYTRIYSKLNNKEKLTMRLKTWGNYCE